MTDFDRIYALVQEMNRDWDRAVVAIRNREPKPPAELRNVKIVDRYDGTEFGTVVIDSRGVLRSITLDPYEVSNANEAHILGAMISTLNSIFQNVSAAGNGGGNR